MSLFEMIFGNGKEGVPLLAALGFKTLDEVGRYRSAWMEKGEDGKPRIAVYTRNGGGNRETYQSIFDTLSNHENYLFDRDDSYDTTYATIYFSIPKSMTDVLDLSQPEWRDILHGPIDMSTIWKKKIDSMS